MSHMEITQHLKEHFVRKSGEIWNESSMFSWTPQNWVHYDFLLHRAGSHQNLQRDMFRLVGFFVVFGAEIFEHVNCVSQACSDNRLLNLVKKYKIREDKTIRDPKVSISVLAGCFPLHVAEYLHLGMRSVLGSVDILPRCLAFPGGLRMIPTDPAWETLTIAWKLWRATIDLNDINEFPTASYMQMDYFRLNTQNMEQVMEAFEISHIPDIIVLQTIENLVRQNRFSPRVPPYPLSAFKERFTIYATGIFSFYAQTRLKQ